MTFRIVMCSALLCLTAGWSAATEAAPAPRTQTLKNGLTLILAPDGRAASVDVTIWYATGPRMETAGKTGLTHVVEQLMFRGSDGVASGEHQRRVRQAGGSVGTHTTHDYTSFFQTVPPEALEMVFELESDRMKSLGATEADMEEVRRLVDLGRQRGGATPVAQGVQQLFATAFEGHPYAWPVIGLEHDVSALTLEDCRAYHREHYTPENAVVTVVGRFDPTEALAAARRTLEKTPRRAGTSSAQPVLSAQSGERRSNDTYVFPVPSLFVGWRLPGAANKDLAALDVAARALVARSASRLNEVLVAREGVAAFIQGGLDIRKDASLLYAVIVLNPGSDSTTLAHVETQVFEELQRFEEEGLDEEEFAGARREIETSIWFGRQRPRDVAMGLGSALLLSGDIRDADRELKALKRMKPTDVARAASRHLTEGNRTIVWMQPAPAEPGVNR